MIHEIYNHILAFGVPPTSAELASQVGGSAEDVKKAITHLKLGKTVLPDPKTGEIWMAGPFSASPTPYVVVGSRTKWWANCAWDMYGIAMLADEAVRIDTKCTDCGEPVELWSNAKQPPTEDGIVHFLVPARRWYDDIGFT